MRYVPLREAEPGMVLAADLYDSVGRTLIGCHCELTESYLEKLEAYGFDGIYIEDKLSEGITIESVITPQLRQEGQERIRACDIDGCKLIARRMVEEILSCGNVSLDLTDLRSYDDYTYAHSVNVAVYCGVIGMGMGMSEVELGHLVTAALLHDLGKLQIPDEILNKPGRLTQEEYLDLLISCITALSPNICLHRITGDGPRKLLIAPQWSLAKRNVLNRLHALMKQRNLRQGDNYEPGTSYTL